MPEISTMSSSRYWRKEDLTPTKTFTIAKIVEEDVSRKDEDPEMGWVAYFEGEKKGCVLNKTNRDNIAYLTGKTNTDHWSGEQITLFNDRSVVYEGRRGGIRVKIPDDFQAPAPTGPIPFDPNQHPMAGDDPPVAREADLDHLDQPETKY